MTRPKYDCFRAAARNPPNSHETEDETAKRADTKSPSLISGASTGTLPSAQFVATKLRLLAIVVVAAMIAFVSVQFNVLPRSAAWMSAGRSVESISQVSAERDDGDGASQAPSEILRTAPANEQVAEREEPRSAPGNYENDSVGEQRTVLQGNVQAQAQIGQMRPEHESQSSEPAGQPVMVLTVDKESEQELRRYAFLCYSFRNLGSMAPLIVLEGSSQHALDETPLVLYLLDAYLVRGRDMAESGTSFMNSEGKARSGVVFPRLLIWYEWSGTRADLNTRSTQALSKIRITMRVQSKRMERPPHNDELNCSRSNTNAGRHKDFIQGDTETREGFFLYHCQGVQVNQATANESVKLPFSIQLHSEGAQLQVNSALTVLRAPKVDVILCEWDDNIGPPRSNVSYTLATVVDSEFDEPSVNSSTSAFEALTDWMGWRLEEWLSYHLTLGFHHVYIYVIGTCENLKWKLRQKSTAQDGVSSLKEQDFVTCVSMGRGWLSRSRGVEGEGQMLTIAKHVIEEAIVAVHLDRFGSYYDYLGVLSPDRYLVIDNLIHNGTGSALSAFFELSEQKRAHKCTSAPCCGIRLSEVLLHPNVSAIADAKLIEEVYTSTPASSSELESVEDDPQASLVLLRKSRVADPPGIQNGSAKMFEKYCEVISWPVANASIAVFSALAHKPKSQQTKSSFARRWDVLGNVAWKVLGFMLSHRVSGPVQMNLLHARLAGTVVPIRSTSPFMTREQLYPNGQVFERRKDVRIPYDHRASSMTRCSHPGDFGKMEPLVQWGVSGDTREIFLLDAYLVRVPSGGNRGMSAAEEDLAVETAEFSVHFLLKYRGPFDQGRLSWLNHGLPFQLRLGADKRASLLSCHLDPLPYSYRGEGDTYPETWYGYHCDSFVLTAMDRKCNIGKVLKSTLLLDPKAEEIMRLMEPNLAVKPAHEMTLCEWDPDLGMLAPRGPHLEKNFALVTMIQLGYATNAYANRQPTSEERIEEWLAYHLYIGFNDITVYVDGNATQTAELVAQLHKFMQTGRLRILQTFRNRILSERPQFWMRLKGPIPNEIDRMRDHQRTVFSAHVDRFAKYHRLFLISDVDEFLFFDDIGAGGAARMHMSGIDNARRIDNSSSSTETPLAKFWSVWRSRMRRSDGGRVACQLRLRWRYYEFDPRTSRAIDEAGELPAHERPYLITEQYKQRRNKVAGSIRGESKAIFIANETTFYTNQHGAYKFQRPVCTESYLPGTDSFLAHYRYAKADEKKTFLVPHESPDVVKVIRETLKQIETGTFPRRPQT
ncbi:hypothetical protein FVE85_5489 [Porphyridium purpureum]|uniref:Glycosyltransferase family 92 protein n=1 Tax=Porphyridium purpureum TaxID=35688 RepID=A0A5J4Z4N4_PORPP|nr:hypothetical protein FVE85_5489 [Porphyridium purpureum]|eukprot:POR3125..scf295_1